MKLLALECSAGPVSAVLLTDGMVEASAVSHLKITHSETLLPMAEDILTETKTDLADIDCFAVAAGPGSFTGVRIGVSAVKGLAFPDRPCCPVSPLRAAAYAFLDRDCIVCGAMDARRAQVYNGIYEVKNGRVSCLVPDRALAITDLLTELADKPCSLPIILAGDGAHLVAKAAESTALTGWSLAEEDRRYPSAVGVALAAYEDYKDGKTVPASALQPIYLRLPQAERELAMKQQKENLS